MKKLVPKVLAVIMSVLMIVSSVLPAYAYCTASLLTNSLNGNNWMSGIRDDVKLSDISIPGTHDSGSRIVSVFTETWAKTQNHSIGQQLLDGMRYFDMRLEHANNVLYNAQVVHGSIDCMDDEGGRLALYEVFESMYSFLRSNPTETILVSCKQDDGDDINALADDINKIINLNPSFWYTGTSTPTLGSVRGKCVLVSRINQLGRGISISWGDQGSDGGAVDYSWMKAQDRYNMGVANKWNNAVVPMLDEVKPSGKWYINFLSTTGGGIAGVPSTSREMNQYFLEYQLKNNKCYGVIMFDYGTADLAKRVYKCNDHIAKNQPSKDSGQYYYRINIDVPEASSAGWSYVSLRLYYKANNGTGTENSVLLFENGDTYDGYYFVCNQGNFDLSGQLNGFPTRLEFRYSWSNGGDRLRMTFRTYVSGASTDTPTQCMEESFNEVSATGTKNYYINRNAYPTPNSVKFNDASNMTVVVPAHNSTQTNTYTIPGAVYDQYGVKWYAEPSLSTGTSCSGVTVSGKNLKINSAANDLPPNSSLYLYCTYQYSGTTFTSSGKKIVLSTNPIPYYFKNEDGTILQQGTAYAGSTPTYTGSTPQKAYDESGHYNFSGWASAGTLSLTNNTYTATYGKAQHIRSITELTKSPTCTEEGYNTNYCMCGYSWITPIPATGHNLITSNRTATCTENGYTRLQCQNCDHIESEQIYPATGHDTDGAYEGEFVNASQSCNGYTPYFCPVCNEEITELRVYDDTDWSRYYDAVKMVNDIKNYDADYPTYDEAARTALEAALEAAQQIEESDQSETLQIAIDNAMNEILNAIGSFSDTVGVEYHTMTFVYAGGDHTTLTYKAGTPSGELDIPSNTATLITDSTHTIYRWPTVQNVTKDITYKENNARSVHAYNTFIFPDEYIEATCTESGYTRHTCICGHQYDETTASPIGHLYNTCIPNGDGTHTRICENDGDHILTENCTINPETHRCIVCGYEIDMSAYYAILEYAQGELLRTDKYTAETLAVLSEAIENAISASPTIDTQSAADAVVADVQSVMSMLELNQFEIVFYCITDNENIVMITEISGTYRYGDNVDLVINDDYMDGAFVEKWTVENTDDNVTSNLHSTDESVTAVITHNSEYIAYLSTYIDNDTVNYSAVSVATNSNRVADVVYIPNGDYDVAWNSNTITLSNADGTYLLNADEIPFYRIGNYLVRGRLLSNTITISGDTSIKPMYIDR